MKKLFLLTAILFISLNQIFAQDPAALLEQWDKKAPLEKVWLHLDRENYVAGETAWFKAYLFSDYRPDTLSSVLYVELLGENDKLISRGVFPVLIGAAWGQVEIPDTLQTGVYLLRAYTPTMLNNGVEYIFCKRISLQGRKTTGVKAALTENKLLVDFFPEGGNLITGLNNTIAFKATDAAGRPVDISGRVVNSRGEQIAILNSYHDGMGLFEINPVIGETYTARFSGKFEGQQKTLPLSQEKGVVLAMIPHPQGAFFEIRHRQDDPQLRPSYMIGQMQHRVVFRQDLNPAKEEWQGVLNTEKLNSGILQVTVFGKSGIPLAERLFFIHNGEYRREGDIQADTLGISPKARNRFRIRLKDTIQGSLSVSVTDADYSLLPYREETIQSSLLLSADLRGYIHNPAWYLQSEEDTVKTARDLLMMTQGWRRFRWEELADKVKGRLAFADPAYITIAGKVNLDGSSRAFAEKQLVALITAEGMKRNAQFIHTDKQGNFTLDSLLFFGSARIFILDIRGKKSQYIDVSMSSDSLGRRYPVVSPGPVWQPPAAVSAEKQKKLAEDFDAIQKANGLMLEEVTIKVRMKTPAEELNDRYARGMFSGDAASVFDMINTNDVVVQENVFEYLQSRVPGLQVVAPDYATAALPSLENPFDDPSSYRLYYRQGPSASSLGNIPMALYLDEVETSGAVIATIPANQIALVKVFSQFAQAPGGGAGGALAIYTKKGADFKAQSRGDMIRYNGFTVVKEFFAPDYKKEPSLTTKPDNRITLDWRPNIFVNNVNPVIPFSFYNNDRTRRFRVVVEGMTTDGKLIYLEKIISDQTN